MALRLCHANALRLCHANITTSLFRANHS